MTSKISIFLALTITTSSLLSAQSARRWVVVAAHGPAARANAIYAYWEEQLTDALTVQLSGTPGVTLIDRSSVDKILKEQNFQNTDRSSPDTAVRIGKLLGAGQIVLMQVVSVSWTTHPEQSGNTTRVLGTVTLSADARLIDIETAVIQAQAASSYQDTALISETTKSNGSVYGPFRTPPKQKTTGGDPTVIATNEAGKATSAVIKEIAAKLTAAAQTTAAPHLESALVAGIVSGAVYINRGSAAGVKMGDKFQIVREVSLGINDPQTNLPMTKKQQVCVLTIVNVDDSNASGSCQGGLPQSKDRAEPMH